MQPPPHSSNQPHFRIAELIQSGDYDKALRLANKQSRKYPDNAEIWYLLASLYAYSGEIENVISCCQRVIHINSRHAGALLNLATALHKAGRHKEALLSYRRCFEVDPSSTNSLNGMGSVYRSLGNYESARECFISWLRLEPGNPQPLLNIGGSYSAEGKHQEACSFYNKALRIDPKSAETHYFMGLAWQSAGSPENASEAYRNAISIRPDYLEALNNLGHIHVELGQLHEAKTVFSKLTSLYPNSADAHNNIGIVYGMMGKFEEAECSYKTAISIDPSFTDTLCHLGYMLIDNGRTDEAIEYFDRAISIKPEMETAIAGKAVAFERLGNINEAFRAIEPLITKGSHNLHAVLAYCKISLHYEKPDPAIKLASTVLLEDDLSSQDASALHHLLGDLYDHRTDYASAFKQHELANNLSPCTYVHEKYVNYIDRIIRHTNSELLANLPRAKHNFRNIVFIVGMPRSGTSLVEQILSSHPEVYGAGELLYINDIVAANLTAENSDTYPEGIINLEQGDVDALAQKYIQSVEKFIPDSTVLIDKMPHNYIGLGLISLLFPRAKVIHVKRNPMDNCLSLYFHHFNAMHSYSTRLNLLGKYYRQHERLMKHWKTALDIPILEICYEEIIDNFEFSAHNLVEFCDLPWSKKCLIFYKNDRFIKTPSYNQVRRPIYTSSVGRWEHYEKYLDPLKQALSDKQ